MSAASSLLVAFLTAVVVDKTVCQSTTTKPSISSFASLGCYSDGPITGRDISAVFTAGSNMTAVECCQSCQQTGYPYAGLQEAATGSGGGTCYCGSSFGSRGPSQNCGQRCGDDMCGATNTASYIYYTVDSSTKSSRSSLLDITAQPFDVARAECVMNGGDLASIITKQDLNDTTLAIATSGSGSDLTLVWIGMKLNKTTESYEWLDPTIDYWNISDNTVTYTPVIPQQGSIVALYVIMPIFFICCCGSSIAYACTRMCRLLRSRPKVEKPKITLNDSLNSTPSQPHQPLRTHSVLNSEAHGGGSGSMTVPRPGHRPDSSMATTPSQAVQAPADKKPTNGPGVDTAAGAKGTISSTHVHNFEPYFAK